MLIPEHNQHGVTLIEMMIAITIAALLMMLGVPSFNLWIQNTQTRTAAESILSGLQLARTEAVKRNTTTRFVLCGAASSSWEILAASAAAPLPPASLACGAGSNALAGEERVQERSAQEGSINAQIQVTPVVATTLTFNSMGRVATNDPASASITQVVVSNPKGDRPLRITVSTGGSLRMCDPSPKLLAGDPRAC